MISYSSYNFNVPSNYARSVKECGVRKPTLIFLCCMKYTSWSHFMQTHSCSVYCTSDKHACIGLQSNPHTPQRHSSVCTIDTVQVAHWKTYTRSIWYFNIIWISSVFAPVNVFTERLFSFYFSYSVKKTHPLELKFVQSIMNLHHCSTTTRLSQITGNSWPTQTHAQSRSGWQSEDWRFCGNVQGGVEWLHRNWSVKLSERWMQLQEQVWKELKLKLWQSFCKGALKSNINSYSFGR